MSSWNGLDFFIFLIFFLNMILGMSRGASKEIISLMCVSASLIITIKFTVPLATFLGRSPGVQDMLTSSMIQNFMASIGGNPLTNSMLSEFAYCLSILICFVGTFSATEAVLSVTGITEVYTFPYATMNRKVGAGLGCIRGYIFTVIVILMIQHLTNGELLRNSYFGGLFSGMANKFDTLIAEQQPERYKELYEDKGKYKASDVINATQW